MAPSERPADGQRPPLPEGAPSYRPWAEFLARTFAVDILACPKCHGRMRLLAMVEEPANVDRYLAAVGEATDVPSRSPGRGPPYWKSRVLRRRALGDEVDGQGPLETGDHIAGVENGRRATGRRSLRLKPDRDYQPFSAEGQASQSRARRGWQPPGMGRPDDAC